MKNSISFNLGNYKNISEMMDDVSELMRLLVKNGYECLFRYEEVNVYILEYCYADHTYGADRFMRVSAEEEETICDMRYNRGE
jgi:hypothetical protein